MNLLKLLINFLPLKIAYAHCDIPCGIYDPKPAQMAAQTMLKMVQKIKAEPEPEIDSDEAAIGYTNSVVRYIWTKEEHGRICKHELSTLWSDYFKEEHLEKYPDLHDKFWKALKLVSKVKQTTDESIAQELVKAVDEIADIFTETKKSA